MNYLSSYYWRQGDSGTALVLKHLRYRDGSSPVLLGVLCEEEAGTLGAQKPGARFARNMTDWFYGEGILLCKKGGATQELFWKKLEEQIDRERSTFTGEVSGSVLLCVGDGFALWNQGDQRICLINTRFGKTNIRTIAAPGQENFLAGELQEGVGILAVAEELYKVWSDREMTACLQVRELTGQDRVERRLREVCEEAYRRGGHGGAMLVVTCK